ncbi:MAG: L,D-transpeptidase family protein [Desulfomicrobium apsheronum]|nr:L,D-transpeptidase family protein [Desulfomicrobium apsheronum]
MKRILPSLAAAVLVLLLVHPGPAWALRSFMLTPDTALYGVVRQVKVEGEDTLLDIAREFGLGYNQIVAANPGIDPWVPPKGELVKIPLAFMLPRERPQAGVVVNLAEMRLYFFFSNGGHDFFFTAPIGIGREGYLTELGVYKVKSKTPNPTWVVPASIREEEPDLPAEVPPGPDNPLGDFVFRLSRNLYAIHGTNKPWGIGRRVSHGCIRMYPEDVGALYPVVPVGATVQVIYEPVKYGWGDGLFWVQAFEDFEKRAEYPLMKIMEELLYHEATIGPLDIDRQALERVLEEKTGVPMVVARPREK